MGQSSFVPFHKGNGTGGTHRTRLVNDSQGITPIECVQTEFLVPLVPLVSHIPWNGTKTATPHTKGTAALGVMVVDSLTIMRSIRRFCLSGHLSDHSTLYQFVSAVSGVIQAIQPIHEIRKANTRLLTFLYVVLCPPGNYGHLLDIM